MANSTIYRGYDIQNTGGEFAIRLNEQTVHRVASEEAAMNWVDAEKRAQREKAGK